MFSHLTNFDNISSSRIDVKEDFALNNSIPLINSELRLAYKIALRARVVDTFMIRLVQTKEVRFGIWGHGEEIHGVATALALSKLTTPKRCGIALNYRSGALASLWGELNNHPNFTKDIFRQLLSRQTDCMSGGRYSVYHISNADLGLLPMQTPVGMQLGKAAGYAKGFQINGIKDSLVVAVVGDATTAEGDLHDAMNAASVWKLPLMIMITDNNGGGWTLPEEGRGIKDFEAYAKGFNIKFMPCDGSDFFDTYHVVKEAAAWVKIEQAPLVLLVKNLPRLSGHSSADDVRHRTDLHDPLLSFGKELLTREVLTQSELPIKNNEIEMGDFLTHYYGPSVQVEVDYVESVLNEVRLEPTPDPDSVAEYLYPPFPKVVETQGIGKQTGITIQKAIRAGIHEIIKHHNGVAWGIDIGRFGGLLKTTLDLKKLHPSRVLDSPLNEPLILGTAVGASFHESIITIPELQHADFAFNAFHWLVHLGNLYWSTVGNVRPSVIVRIPSESPGGGAIYHSMTFDGYAASIPGLVVLMPSTSLDAYGLMMSAADYKGPVVYLEPKPLYGLCLGGMLPGESEQSALEIVPEFNLEIRIPFSKAAVKRSGKDLTLLAWGTALHKSMMVAERLSKDVDVEVIDLRTLIPPDWDSIFNSIRKTGHLVVACEDQPMGSLARTIQGQCAEKFPNINSRVVGKKEIPIGMAFALEQATILQESQIEQAIQECCRSKSNLII